MSDVNNSFWLNKMLFLSNSPQRYHFFFSVGVFKTLFFIQDVIFSQNTTFLALWWHILLNKRSHNCTFFHFFMFEMIFFLLKFGWIAGNRYLCSRFPGCSAVGSVPGLGPGGRPFESGRPDNRKVVTREERNLISQTPLFFYTMKNRISKAYEHRRRWPRQ